jgi:hypothetical protein
MQKANRAFQRDSEKRERQQRGKVGLKSPSLQKMYSAPARQSRLAPNRLTGQDKASPAKSRRLLMCWQLLACIPSALVEGDNIRPQDVCWANAHRARAHRCGLAACRRTWPPQSRLLLQGAPCAYVRSQTLPCGARSAAILPHNACEPFRNTLFRRSDVSRDGRGCRADAGPKLRRRK